MEDARPRCHVATFGCRVNQADSEGILTTLAERGYTPSDSHLDAEVVVINSCTVTHRSDADVRKLVHRIERENPKAKVVVAGCYAQRAPEALVALGGLSAIVGHSGAHHLGDVLDQLQTLPRDAGPLVVRTAMDEVDPTELPPVDPVAVVHDRTRPFVKIQDGCDARCTYCVIPEVRGPARSAPADKVVHAVERLVSQGYFEIVVAGIHLGTYGGGTGFAELISRLLDVPGLGRLRLSAIEPMAFPRELITLAEKNARLAPHFHLPLQSACDRILKRMNRPYRAADFQALAVELKARLPWACLGTDVITGFPGETEEDFEETRAFVERSPLDYVHVFSYSDRPGVPSTRLRDKVEPRIIRTRTTRLIETGRELWTRFLERRVGTTVDALTLQRNPEAPEIVEALGADYAPIRCADTTLEANRPVRFSITKREGAVLWGVPA